MAVFLIFLSNRIKFLAGFYEKQSDARIKYNFKDENQAFFYESTSKLNKPEPKIIAREIEIHQRRICLDTITQNNGSYFFIWG